MLEEKAWTGRPVVVRADSRWWQDLTVCVVYSSRVHKDGEVGRLGSEVTDGTKGVVDREGKAEKEGGPGPKGWS